MSDSETSGAVGAGEAFRVETAVDRQSNVTSSGGPAIQINFPVEAVKPIIGVFAAAFGVTLLVAVTALAASVWTAAKTTDAREIAELRADLTERQLVLYTKNTDGLLRESADYNAKVYNRLVAVDADLTVLGLKPKARYGAIPLQPEIKRRN